MKLTAIILLSACLTASAVGNSQNITIQAKNAPLEKVLLEVKKQSGYHLFYKDEWMQKTKLVDIQAVDKPVEEVLRICFKNQPFTFEIVDKTIVIKEKIADPNEQPTIVNELPPPITVKGRVINENGEGVRATITVKGTTNRVSSDDNGNFVIENVDDNAILVITSTSIEETVELKVNGKMDIGLVATKTKVKEGEDVMIGTSYYKTTRDKSTSSISKVTAKDFDKQPVSNPLMAMQGRMPGVAITQTSGVAGAGMTIEIRGRNSIRSGANYPLYVIDGVPVNSTPLTTQTSLMGGFGVDPLNTINPANIESVEILKDADATAIYGSRGANGVVLITTKKGKAGKTNLEASFSSGTGKASRMMKLLNTRQYLDMRYEAFRNDGLDFRNAPFDYTDDLLKWDTTRYTDWQKELFGGTAHISDVQLAVSGGSQNTSFRISGGMHRETTVFPTDDIYNKAMAGVSLSHQSTDRRFGTTLSVNYGFDKSNQFIADVTSQAIQLVPVAPRIYDDNGKLNWEKNTWTNPFANFLKTVKRTTNNFVSNLTLQYEVFPGLNLKANLGYTDFSSDEVNNIPKASFAPNSTNQSQSTFVTNKNNTWNIEPQVTYAKSFDWGQIDMLAGATFQNRSNILQQLRASNYPNDALLGNMQAGATFTAIQVLNLEYKYAALFGRLGYNFKGRYLMNFTMRRDGSSRFGPDKRFGTFAAVGAGWIFSKEKFFDNMSFLSFGKLRASYGTSGSDNVPDYGYLRTYSPGSSSGAYGGTVQLFPNGLANPDYAWEVTKKLELALELRFLGDRLSVEASWFRNRSSNQLVGFPLPPSTGFTSVQQNLPATVQNQGLELVVSTSNIQSKSINWTTSANLTIPTNMLVSYPNLAGSSFASTYIIGESVFGRKAYTSIGINPSTGLYQMQDVNGDNVFSTVDRNSFLNLGRKYYGGLTNTLTMKSWEFSFLIELVKLTSYDYGYIFVPPGLNSNQPVQVMEATRWQKPGDAASIQKFSQSYGAEYEAYTDYTQTSDGGLKNGYYTRLKTVSLSYNIPLSLLKKAKMQSASVYLQGQNLFTMTNFIALNPERPTGSTLPPLKLFTAGIKITL